jgi:hypothetical protein
MRRTILLAGVLPFISAFLGGVLAFSLVTAPQAMAQFSQPQEVRAAAFSLVGTDGAVIARLAPSATGNGNLSLNDATGMRRVAITAVGEVNIYDQEGTLVFRAGRSYGPGPIGTGPVNGVQLGPGGSISMIPPQP